MKHIIVIPVYNDWKSLKKLLFNLNKCFAKIKKKSEILIVNDNSSQKTNLKKIKFNFLEKIKVLNLRKNVGSQIAIASGLMYLKRKSGNFIVTVMDADGEDDPNQVSKMLKLAIKYPNYVIASARLKREESKIIVLSYYVHLLMTFIFTLKWISFGNFTSFHKKNLSHLFLDNSSIFAHSSAVFKNCDIKRVFAKRKKRYFDKSKLGIFSLIEHSLRVNAVYINKIIFTSLIYILIILTLPTKFSLTLILPIIIFNFIVIYIRIKFSDKKLIYHLQKDFN